MYGTAPLLSCSAPGLSCPAPGLTVSPAVCCFEGFVVASGAGLSCLLCSWTPWGMARVWHGYGSREGKECALHLSMCPRYGTGMARDWEGMARDIAAGLGNIFTLNYEVVHTFSLTERCCAEGRCRVWHGPCAIVWHGRLCHTLCGVWHGPCAILWHERLCHTMARKRARVQNHTL